MIHINNDSQYGIDDNDDTDIRICNGICICICICICIGIGIDSNLIC